MSRNTDYWENIDEPQGEEILLRAMELSDLIEERLESKSRKNRTEVNELIDEYNTRFGKTYKRV